MLARKIWPASMFQFIPNDGMELLYLPNVCDIMLCILDLAEIMAENKMNTEDIQTTQEPKAII